MDQLDSQGHCSMEWASKWNKVSFLSFDKIISIENEILLFTINVYIIKVVFIHQLMH